MEKYRLIQEHKADSEQDFLVTAVSTAGYPEVRITQQGKPRNYISYAMNLFVCLIGSPAESSLTYLLTLLLPCYI
jgi:hypothetical protein